MRLIVGISGASGVILGVELLKALRGAQCETHLVLTRDAVRTMELETPYSSQEVAALASASYSPGDMSAPIASGSFKTGGMVVIPCSMKTLSAVANGYTENLLQRAADVCLKEGRKVVLVPRETPLNRIHLKNLLAASEAGCVVLPPVLTFYNRPASIQDMIDHLVGKILQQFDLEFPGFRAWDHPG
jgi:flavin prenyltransferase